MPKSAATDELVADPVADLRATPVPGQTVVYRAPDPVDSHMRPYMAMVLAVHSDTVVDLHAFYNAGDDNHERAEVALLPDGAATEGDTVGWYWPEA